MCVLILKKNLKIFSIRAVFESPPRVQPKFYSILVVYRKLNKYDMTTGEYPNGNPNTPKDLCFFKSDLMPCSHTGGRFYAIAIIIVYDNAWNKGAL